MILPSFLKELFSRTNPYEKIMDSIGKIRNEHKNNNKLGFVGDKIMISKKDNHYDLCYCLIMENNQTMTMTYRLEISDKEFLPSRISEELETRKESIIEQNRW